MRRDDIEQLGQAYRDQEADSATRFASRLGVAVPHAPLLADEILADLDEQRFGVGWWAKMLPPAKRILIADQLWLCATGVQTNLVEAALHFLELRGAWERESDRNADMLQYSLDGRIVVKMEPSLAPTADLPHAMIHLHTAGVFRGVGSALDCLGGAIVGVAGLGTSILRSDFDRARSTLAKAAKASTGPAAEMRALKTQLDETISTAGPDGWLQWATDYRNMYVHRGRRTQMMKSEPRSDLFGADKRPLLRLKSFAVLAIDPGHSEIEVIRDTGLNLLTESAETSLRELLESARFAIDGICAALVDLWKRRRSEPSLIAQPIAQWKEEAASTAGFKGYRPGTVPSSMDDVVVNPSLTRRLAAASLKGDARKNWDRF